MQEKLVHTVKTPAKGKIGVSCAGCAYGIGSILPMFITYFMTESLAVPVLQVTSMIMAYSPLG